MTEDLMKKKLNQQQRFPANVTDRLDPRGDKLGVWKVPGALLRVNLGLGADDILFCSALFDHYREPGDQPHPSYVRIGLMIERDRKTVAAIAERLDKSGVVPRTKHRRGYKHDLGPLLAKMATDPLKEFPSFANEKLWDRDQKIARLIAENVALRNGLLTRAGTEVTPGESKPSISQQSIVIEDFTVTAAEVRQSLDYWLFSAEGREMYPDFIGTPDLTDEDLLDSVKKKNSETPYLSKERLLRSAAYGLYSDLLEAKGVKIPGESDGAPLTNNQRIGLADQDPDDFIAEFAEPAVHDAAASAASAASGSRGAPGAAHSPPNSDLPVTPLLGSG